MEAQRIPPDADRQEVVLYLRSGSLTHLHQRSASRYRIQSGNIRPPRPPPGALVPGGPGAAVGRRAGPGAALAGGMRVGVPCAVPVGAVADRLLVNVQALPRWDHPAPSKAVGT